MFGCSNEKQLTGPVPKCSDAPYQIENLKFTLEDIEKIMAEGRLFVNGVKVSSMEHLHEIKKSEDLKELFRELLMRGNYAFPENEQDLQWFEEGIKPGNFERFLNAAGIFADKDE